MANSQNPFAESPLFRGELWERVKCFFGVHSWTAWTFNGTIVSPPELRMEVWLRVCGCGVEEERLVRDG